MSLKIGPIRLRTAEFTALDCLTKIPYTYNGRNVVITLDSTFIFDWIFFILAGNEDNHKRLREVEFQADSTTDSGVSCF